MPNAKHSQTDEWRERRRMQAWELHQQGWSQRKIADELGITQGAVSQWLKRARGSGAEALRHRPPPGRRAGLSSEQLSQLPELIAQGAEAFGFRGERWTTVRISAVIEQTFGVSYHPAHVSRILKKYCPSWREDKQA